MNTLHLDNTQHVFYSLHIWHYFRDAGGRCIVAALNVA